MNAYDPQAYTIPCVDSIQTEMATHLHLAPVGNQAVDLDFDGGLLSSDAGLMLLKDPDEQLGLTRALAAVLKDSRDPRRVHFTLHDLLKQPVLQIAAGYEDGWCPSIAWMKGLQSVVDRLLLKPVAKVRGHTIAQQLLHSPYMVRHKLS